MAAEASAAAGGFTKIKVENPVVDILGDEMTRIIWDVRSAPPPLLLAPVQCQPASRSGKACHAHPARQLHPTARCTAGRHVLCCVVGCLLRCALVLPCAAT